MDKAVNDYADSESKPNIKRRERRQIVLQLDESDWNDITYLARQSALARNNYARMIFHQAVRAKMKLAATEK